MSNVTNTMSLDIRNLTSTYIKQSQVRYNTYNSRTAGLILMKFGMEVANTLD